MDGTTNVPCCRHVAFGFTVQNHLLKTQLRTNVKAQCQMNGNLVYLAVYSISLIVLLQNNHYAINSLSKFHDNTRRMLINYLLVWGARTQTPSTRNQKSKKQEKINLGMSFTLYITDPCMPISPGKTMSFDKLVIFDTTVLMNPSMRLNANSMICTI